MTKCFFKKTACFILSLCAIPCVISKAEGIEMASETVTIEYVEQLAENYANAWANAMYDEQVTPLDIIKVVNSSDEVIAYEVSFCNISTLEPMGYVVLSTDLSLENPVIEFALDGYDLYTQQQLDNPSVLSSESLLEETVTQDKILMSDDMLLYSTVTEKTTSEYNLPSYPQPRDLLPLNGGLSSTYVGTVEESNFAQGSSGLTFYRGADFDSSGVNCVPTALTNMVVYYETLSNINGLLYNNPTQTYARICALANFTGTQGLSNDEMCNVLEEYVSERDFNISIDDYRYDWWSDFTRDINRDRPVLVSIQGAGDDGYWTAHAVAAFGYVETDNAKYLKVADGNYSSQRYLNYDYYGVHEGFCVYIY